MKPNILESGKCFRKTGIDTDLFDFKHVEYKGEVRYIVLFHLRQVIYTVNEFNNSFVVTGQNKHSQTMKQRREITERRNRKEKVADKCSQITFINGIEAR